jgi:hypothetical protein
MPKTKTHNMGRPFKLERASSSRVGSFFFLGLGARVLILKIEAKSQKALCESLQVASGALKTTQLPPDLRMKRFIQDAQCTLGRRRFSTMQQIS